METNSKSGFSLVEIMVAVLILTVLALGGAAILYRAGGTVAIQNGKRAAISAANRRLEQLSTVPYADIASSGYINRFNNVVASEPDETVTINGRQRKIVAKVDKMMDASWPAREFARVTVQVDFRSGENPVSMTTNLR